MAGSIPIIEDVQVDQITVHPQYDLQMRCQQRDIHGLLKELKAPVLFVREWNELPAILGSITDEAAQQMQVDLIQWYDKLNGHLQRALLQGLLAM